MYHILKIYAYIFVIFYLNYLKQSRYTHMNPYLWDDEIFRDPWTSTIIFELSQSSSFRSKVVIGKQASPLDRYRRNQSFGPPDCKININLWIKKEYIIMRKDFIVIRRAQVGQLECLLFILTVTYTNQGMCQVCPLLSHNTRWVFSFISF